MKKFDAKGYEANLDDDRMVGLFRNENGDYILRTMNKKYNPVYENKLRFTPEGMETIVRMYLAINEVN